MILFLMKKNAAHPFRYNNPTSCRIGNAARQTPLLYKENPTKTEYWGHPIRGPKTKRNPTGQDTGDTRFGGRKQKEIPQDRIRGTCPRYPVSVQFLFVFGPDF